MRANQKLWCCKDLQCHTVDTVLWHSFKTGEERPHSRTRTRARARTRARTHTHTHTHTQRQYAHLNNLISLFKTEGTSKQSSYTFLCSFVAVLTVSVNMQEVTSHLVYLHYISIVSTNLFALQSRAFLHMTPCVDPL